MAVKNRSLNDIDELKAEIVALNKRVDNLQASMKKTKKSSTNKWRRPVIGISIVIAVIVLVLGNIFFWTSRTLIDTNRYVATVGPLIKQPPIQSAIASYTTNQIFSNYDVQGFVSSSLPPKAAFLAPELTSQVKNYTQSTIKALLANSKVQQYWYKSITRSHDNLIRFSKSYQGNGTITISDIYSQLSSRLAGTKLSFLANKTLPSKVSSIKITTIGWLPYFHKLVLNVDLYETLAVLIFFIFSGIAVLLSKKKLRMIARLGLVYAAFMLITLIAINIMRNVFVSKINQQYKDAATSAYNVVLKSFGSQTIDILIISLLIAVVAWIVDYFHLIDKLKPLIADYQKRYAPVKKVSKK